MGIDTMVPIPNNLYIFDKTTQKTVFASAINEYLKKECINIFRDLNANDFKNSLEKHIERYRPCQEDNLIFPNLNYWSICKSLKKGMKECG